MKAKRGLSQTGAGWLVTFLVGAVLILSAACRGHGNEFMYLDSKRTDKLLEAAGLSHHHPGVFRNQTGSRLFLTQTSNASTLVITISANRLQTNVLSEVPVAITEGAQPICSLVGRALVFQTGERIPLVTGSRWGFSHDRAFFFFLHELPAGGAVFRTSNPLRTLIELPAQFLPQRIFTRTNEIVVFGRKYPGGKAPGIVIGLVFTKRQPVPELAREIELSRFGGVLDMDSDTGLLLVEGKEEMFKKWGLFNPATLEYKPLGAKNGHGFYLEPAFCRYLEKLFEEK